MPDPPPYRVYRSRPKLLSRGGELGDRPGSPAAPAPGRPRRPTKGRVARWLALALLAWLAVSALAFLASSLTAEGVSDEAEAVLAKESVGLAGPATVLLLGSDARPEGSKEGGADPGGPSRADSILLLRTGGGASRKLSIPRDTMAEIPGRGRDKVNAAFAIGGSALTIQTIQDLLGIRIDHVMLIDFERFPGLIDAMGGIDYTGGCVVSRINGGARNGGVTLRLKAGENHLTGKQALALARTRKNSCRPNEDDRARARRQQKIVAAMRSRAISPSGFIRLPKIAWAAPRALRTDLAGPSLMALVLGAVVSGDAEPSVLPTGNDPGGGSGLVVDEARKARAVERFLAG